MQVLLTLDATATAVPDVGRYGADLHLSHDAPFVFPDIPVVMTALEAEGVRTSPGVDEQDCMQRGSVEYIVTLNHGAGELKVENPALLPDPGEIESIAEPWVKLSIVTPATYIGSLMELGTNHRATFLGMEYLDPERVLMEFELPLAEDFESTCAPFFLQWPLAKPKMVRKGSVRLSTVDIASIE